MNSNTSGASVASVGFWPLSILGAVIAQANIVINSLKGNQAGTLVPAAVDFAGFQGSDKLPDAIMEEIARRLVITFEQAVLGNIVFSPNPPEDHSKAWLPTDAITGLPIDGRVKVWDEATQSWVFSDNQGGYVPPKKKFAKRHVAAGGSTVNFTFADIETENYFPTLTFTTQNEDGTWAAAPGSYPAGFGYLITNKTNTTCTVAFYAVPVGGMTAELQVEEIIA